MRHCSIPCGCERIDINQDHEDRQGFAVIATKKKHKSSHSSKTSRNMINALPDLVLALIFSYLPDVQRICTITLVCRKWYDVIHSSAVWKKVDFDFQRRITSEILQKFIYPGTREVFLTECHYLEWIDLCHILSRCEKLAVLVLSWIGYRKQSVPADFSTVLSIGYLRLLDLSHCKVTSSLFRLLPFKCQILEILLLQDCQEISQESYLISPFKQHKHLKLLCVAYNRKALSPHCVVELLKYANCKVLLDIRGHHLTPDDFSNITREHCDALERIKRVEDYEHMLR